MIKNIFRFPSKIAALSFGLVAIFFVLREHWGHVLGFSPYLLLLACPLLHLFHHHGGHNHHDGQHDGDHA